MRANKKLRKISVNLVSHPDYVIRKNNFSAIIEKFLYQHRHKLIFVHVSMFLLFLSLILIPIFLPTPPENATAFSNFTLFSQFLLWGIWFPLVFASVIFSGRSWCGLLCPMGAASEWMSKIGLQRKIPGWLKWEGTPILSFLLVTILGQTVDVRDQASAMAEVFGGTFFLALLIGFLYGKKNKRAWCRHVCPIGLLLGVFSRLGAVQFAPKHQRPGGDHYTEKGICPTMIAISQKQESRHCIQCFRCVKPSSPGGLFVRFRKLGEEIIKIRQHSASASEVLFIFLSTGIALGGFLWLILPTYQLLRQQIGEWFIEKGWYWIGESGPAWLMSVHPELRQAYNWLDFFMISGFMLACMVATMLLLGGCAWLSARLSGKDNLKTRFIELSYQFTPVAVISIIIGLGELLFSSLHHLGINIIVISTVKGVLLAASILWSMFLGRQILLQQGVKQYIPCIPGMLGSIVVGLAWWPAIFGVNFSLLEQYRQQLIILS